MGKMPQVEKCLDDHNLNRKLAPITKNRNGGDEDRRVRRKRYVLVVVVLLKIFLKKG